MQDTINYKSPFIKSVPRKLLVIGSIAILGIGGTTFYLYSRPDSPQTTNSPTVTTTPVIKTVTALGWLEPKGEVIKLQAPTSSQENQISQLLVKRGDRVKADQVVAILDSRDRLQAALEQAQKDVQVSKAKLAQTEAGAKQGEITAQKAEIARLKADQQASINAQKATVERLNAEVQNAEVEYKRYEMLYQQGAISASERDSKRLSQETAQRNLQQAKAELTRLQSTSSPELNSARATLEKIAEVRPVDVKVSQAELNRAIAAAKEAKANLENAYVRSPQDGVVMDIHTRAGEVVSDEGVVEIGQTNQMYAVAEVYQSDIQKVRPGQTVHVTGDAFPGQLQGTVDWVDVKVRKQTVVNTDPSENIDARVIQVWTRLDEVSSQKAAKLTNLQVQVEIEL
jgi:HlyD family secretion protein